MVPPRSPPKPRFCSSLPFIHSVIRPTTGSRVARIRSSSPASMPQRFRAASITAICMPKQMPKYGTCRSRANCAARIFALGAALAEAARHQDAVDMFEERRRVLVLEHLAFDPVEIDLDLVGDAAVRKRLDQRLIGILHAGIFADDGDGDVAFRIADALVDEMPGGEIGLAADSRCRTRRALRRRDRRHDRPPAPRRCCRRRSASITALSRTLQNSASFLRSLSGIGRSVRQSRMSG